MKAIIFLFTLIAVFLFALTITPSALALSKCSGYAITINSDGSTTQVAGAKQEMGVCIWAINNGDSATTSWWSAKFIGETSFKNKSAGICNNYANKAGLKGTYHDITDQDEWCPILTATDVACCANDDGTVALDNAPPPPCSNLVNGVCESVNTGIGTISTDPQSFVATILGILLSVSGGVAILLIIASGYQLMASQGNPEKVKEARERLTSAIVGLLFVIFSLVILRTVTVTILHLPGFNG